MDEAQLVWAAAGGVSVLLAAVVLAVDVRDRVHRALALFLLLEGLRQVFRILEEGPAWVLALGKMTPYLFIARPFALAHFALAFHARLRGLRPARLAGWALLAGALAFEGWYLATRSPLPWDIAGIATELSFPALAALFAWTARRTAGTARRRSLILVGAAFCFFPLAFALHLAIPGLMAPQGTWEDAGTMAGLAGVGLAAALLWTQRLDPDRRVAAQVRVALGLLGVPVVSVAALWAGTLAVGPGPMRPWMIATMGAWALSVLVMLSYAVVRGDIFGLERRLRVTVSRTFLYGFFVAVFLVASKLVEGFVGTLFASQWVVGALVAGLFLFALTPLQRVADRLAQGLMPGVPEPDRMDVDARLAVYREQVEVAWSDGALGLKERQMLDRARQALRLEARQAQRVEEAVVRQLRGQAPAART